MANFQSRLQCIISRSANKRYFGLATSRVFHVVNMECRKLNCCSGSSLEPRISCCLVEIGQLFHGPKLTHTHTHTHRHTHTHTRTHPHTHPPTHTHTSTQTNKQTFTHTNTRRQQSDLKTPPFFVCMKVSGLKNDTVKICNPLSWFIFTYECFFVIRQYV